MKNRTDSANYLKHAEEIRDVENAIAGAADRGEYSIVINRVLSSYTTTWFQAKGYTVNAVGNGSTSLEWKYPPITLRYEKEWDKYFGHQPKISGGIDLGPPYQVEFQNDNETIL